MAMFYWLTSIRLFDGILTLTSDIHTHTDTHTHIRTHTHTHCPIFASVMGIRAQFKVLWTAVRDKTCIPTFTALYKICLLLLLLIRQIRNATLPTSAAG